MVVNNVEQKDIMHDNLYFIKDNENNWKLINININANVNLNRNL